MTEHELKDAICAALIRRGLSDTDPGAAQANRVLVDELAAIAKRYAGQP